MTYNNVNTIARKEFADLLYSKHVLIIIALYIIVSAGTILTFYDTFTRIGYIITANQYLVELTKILSYYGSLVAIVIGFSSISLEINNRSLNTLLVKPVYRDTIINGKILGTIYFIISMFIATTIAFIIFMLLLMGDATNQLLLDIISGLPLVWLFSLLCVTFFLSCSMLTSILFKERSLALFFSVIIWIFMFLLLPNLMIGGYIEGMFGNGDSTISYIISGLSPMTMIGIVLSDAMDFISTLSMHWFEFAKLLLYSTTTTILCYVAFLRRDI